MIERFFDRKSIIPQLAAVSRVFLPSGDKMIYSIISIGYVCVKAKGDLIAVNGREPISTKRIKFYIPTKSHNDVVLAA